MLIYFMFYILTVLIALDHMVFKKTLIFKKFNFIFMNSLRHFKKLKN
jgi:hypothetical protein